MGNRLRIKAMVLTIGMLAGCDAVTPNLRESRLLTGSEMDQITAGSVGAISRAEAHARGFTSQATASTNTLVVSSSGMVAGAHTVNAASWNYVSSQLSASAGNGQTVTASGSNYVYADVLLCRIRFLVGQQHKIRSRSGFLRQHVRKSWILC